jgi:hypothetical protein
MGGYTSQPRMSGQPESGTQYPDLTDSLLVSLSNTSAMNDAYH